MSCVYCLFCSSLERLTAVPDAISAQQFNEPIDGRPEKPSRGVACLDCHSNGETNGAFPLVGDTWPQAFRHRIEAALYAA